MLLKKENIVASRNQQQGSHSNCVNKEPELNSVKPRVSFFFYHVLPQELNMASEKAEKSGRYYLELFEMLRQ